MRRGEYAKTAAVRERILEATRSLTASGGAARVSVRRIARAAGLSHAGVLHHFSSKAALLAAASLSGPPERNPVLDRLGRLDGRWNEHRGRVEAWLRLARHGVTTDDAVHDSLSVGYDELLEVLPEVGGSSARDQLAYLLGLQVLAEFDRGR